MNKNRRTFVKSLTLAGAALASGSVRVAGRPHDAANRRIGEPEWRNRQNGMEYRRLGDTGLMVSAMVIGGGGLNPDRFDHAVAAVERGVNYVDTASRYSDGRSERGVGELAKEVGREKLFISTKFSSYLPELYRFTHQIYETLPAGKQRMLRDKSREMIRNRGVMEPGYHFTYFGDHDEQMPEGYLQYVIRQEYGQLRRWRGQIRQVLHRTMDESLQRLGTDYVDILHCPHGARMPEELEDETIREVFNEIRQAGKARFLGVSIHNDVPNILLKAAELGYYDMAMPAYNIINHPTMDMAIRAAASSGLGIISMKGANPFVRAPGPDGEIPRWRIEKLNRAIPGEYKIPHKAYLFVLQNPAIAGVISAFKNEEMVHENLDLVGKKIEIRTL